MTSVKCDNVQLTKPTLRIGAYRHAMGDGFVEFPMRLERNRTGQHYWSTARGGEYHWWLTKVALRYNGSGENDGNG